MTRVLVDLLFWTGTRGGMESYVRELYRRMPDVAPDLDLVGWASRELAESGADWFPGEVVDSGVAGSERIAWARGELTGVARHARRLRAEVVHSPANVGPWFGRTPVVLTVHDVLPFLHPEWVPGSHGLALRSLVAGAVRHARRIVTVSDASRRDIEAVLAPRARIDVVPLAGPDVSAPTDGPREPASFIAVANALPHKNLELLLELFSRPALADAHLTLYGSAGHGAIADAIRARSGGNVSVAGWVSDAELDAAYRRASALLLPTLFEGFGLPVLEALSRGCPVICSDLPVLREVAGDSASFVPVGDVEAWERAVAAHRTRSPAFGPLVERARGFDWARTAAATAGILREVATRS